LPEEASAEWISAWRVSHKEATMTRGIGFAALFALLVFPVVAAIPGCKGKPPTREQAIEKYSDALREGVSSNVGDERRRAQMLSIVDQLEAVHVRFSRETADFIASYDKLNADYDSTRPAFDQLFSDFSAKRVKARSEAIDLHFQLASLATAAEWDTIGRAESKLYEKTIAARPEKESKE
jgi:hypothetical protein